MAHWRLFILPVIFCFILLNTPRVSSAAVTQCDTLICIHFTPPDSNHAKEALHILVKAREELAADFLIPAHDTFQVIIVPSRAEFRQYIQEGLPRWAHAFATPAMRTMVVRSPRWDRPEASFRQALVHELIHLVLYAGAVGSPLPRWLDEGLALFYAESLNWENQTLLSKALSTGSLIPLQKIDDVLQFQQPAADLAYQQSYSAVRYLMATYDVEAMRHIVSGSIAGKDLDTLFIEATGSSMREFEQEWLKYLEKTEKWNWLIESDELIWIAVPFLFLFAVFVIRWRNRRKLSQWQQEEERMSAEEGLAAPAGAGEETDPPGNSS